MKLFDKIYVPDEMLGPYEACDIRSGHPERGRLYKQENKIVFSIEELRDCFKDARKKVERGDAPYIYPTIEDYLKFKGIQL